MKKLWSKSSYSIFGKENQALRKVYYIKKSQNTMS